MTSNNLEDDIKAIFLDTFPDMKEDEFDLDTKQEEYENWDSFAHLRIVSEIEEKFDIKLDIEDFVYISDASGFLKIIKNKINHK